MTSITTRREPLRHNKQTTEVEVLSGRIGMPLIRDYCLQLKHDASLQKDFFGLLGHADTRVANNAAWILTHLAPKDAAWLNERFGTLANMAMQTTDKTLQRLLLTLVYRLAFPVQTPICLFNFCIREMLSCHQTYGTRSLCMKIAYEIALPTPELREEIRLTLELMDPTSLPPSLYSSRKNILAALDKRKSLRKPFQ